MYRLPEGFADGIRAGIAHWKETSMGLAKQGWTAPQSLTPADVYDLLGPCSTEADVDAAFVHLFETEDGCLFESTAVYLIENPLTLAWHPLLTQVFAAYRRREFLITVPSLLLVLEGVLSVDAGRSVKVRQRAQDRKSDAERRLPDSLTAAEWAATVVFVGLLFENAPFDGQHPGRLNRHWVLHGRDSADWTQSDCLRLLVALETVCSLLDHEPV
jgi:hypothetical protein